MKIVNVFSDDEIRQLKQLLRQINHDVDVLQQNKNDPLFVNAYAKRIEASVKTAIEMVQ